MTRALRVRRLIVALLVVTSSSLAFGGVAGTSLAATQKADVVFVFDKTGSMDDEAAALKDEIESVAANLESKGIDTRYALIEYEAADNTEIIDLDPESTGVQAFTASATSLATALDDFSTEGGTEDASNAIEIALGLDYRSDAKKIIVVLTDEDDQDYTDANEDGEADIVAAVNAANACLLSVAPDNDAIDELKTYSQLVECGEWSDILSESFSTVVQDLVTFIDESVDEATEPESTPTASPRYEIGERSMDKTELYTNETANVTYVVENVGSASGSYHALLYDNQRVLASERVQLAPGESHTFQWQLSWAQDGQYDVRSKERYVARVTVTERPAPVPPTLDPNDVEVVDATALRSNVIPGEQFEITATVLNNGTMDGQTSVVYAANGTERANYTTMLAAGERVESAHLATAGSPTSPGNVTWTVGGTVAGNVTVLDPNETDSGIIDIYTTKSTVATGESYEVVPVLYNAASSSQSFFIVYSRAGEPPTAMKYVTIAPGETLELPVEVVAPSSAGTDEWTVSGVPAPPVTVTNATAT